MMFEGNHSYEVARKDLRRLYNA
jgi:hypothetical protein